MKYNFIKITAGKRHAWYDTGLGFKVRKPLGFKPISDIKIKNKNYVVDSWLNRLVKFIKRIFHI